MSWDVVLHDLLALVIAAVLGGVIGLERELKGQWAGLRTHIMVAVGATNVTNKQYWLNIFDLSAFGQPTIEGQPGRPREYFLSLTRNFN